MGQDSTVCLRRATAADVPAFLSLVRGLAAYEKLDPPSPDGEARLARDAFGDRPRFDVLLAEIDSRAVGYAIFFETYSSFLALPTLYLEDIFILPESRRGGVGRRMMAWLAAEAVRRGCGRMEWVVLDWNRPAIEFYEQLGATRMREWLPFRLTGEPLRRVADGA